MDDILKNYENIALSDKEVKKLVNGKASIILYPNLVHYKNIDEVLGPHKAAFILFCAKVKPNKYGHWCALFQVDDGVLEFFNPYGGYPDDSLKYIPMNVRKTSNQFHTHLSNLLYKSPYELTYNEFPFQDKNPNIKTCGRHTSVRLAFRNMDLYEYKNFLDQLKKLTGLSYDQVVTLLSLNVC